MAVSREWLPRVLTLLDAAIHQLHHQQEAHTTILMATSLLRRETDPGSARQGPGGKGCLLAWQVRKVREYIDTHLATRILLADLCALVRLGEAHFSRVFKRTFGESPHAFVVRRRLEVATDHMLHTDASLRDIALECGFTDQAHLTKSFRQAMGQTPAAWRRAHGASGATRHRWQRRHSRDLRGGGGVGPHALRVNGRTAEIQHVPPDILRVMPRIELCAKTQAGGVVPVHGELR
jgi:AraC family transcriptional regulator